MAHMQTLALKSRRKETVEDSSTTQSALYCPPLKSIGTDVSVVPAQKTSLPHTVAALTVMRHKVMVGKNKQQLNFTNFLPSQCLFIPLFTFLFSLPLIPPPPISMLPFPSVTPSLPFPLCCAPSPRCMVQQCHLWCAERHFTLSHLPVWICVAMYVYACAQI